MPKCKYCGALLSEDSSFCEKCGKPIGGDEERHCPFCGKVMSPDALFCTFCGKKEGDPADDNREQQKTEPDEPIEIVYDPSLDGFGDDGTGNKTDEKPSSGNGDVPSRPAVKPAKADQPVHTAAEDKDDHKDEDDEEDDDNDDDDAENRKNRSAKALIIALGVSALILIGIALFLFLSGRIGGQKEPETTEPTTETTETITEETTSEATTAEPETETTEPVTEEPTTRLPDELLPYADRLQPENRRYVIKLGGDDWFINYRSSPEYMLNNKKVNNVIGKIQSGTEINVEYICDGTWAVYQLNGTYVFSSIYDMNDPDAGALMKPLEEEETTAANKGTLRMGTSPNFPPYENVTAGGEIDGFDIALIGELGKRCGYEIEIVSIDYEELYNALGSGSVDFVMSGLVAREEKKAVAEYSDVYICNEDYGDDYVIAFSKENAAICAEFNAALAELKADGTIQRLADSYLS